MSSLVNFKIQYIHSEVGEFQLNKYLTCERIIEIIIDETSERFLSNTSTIKHPNISFYLTNDDSYLKITHFAKNVYTINYTSNEIPEVRIGNFYFKSVVELVKLFCNSKKEEFLNRISKKEGKKKKMLKGFKEKSFEYFYNPYDVNFFFIIFYLTLSAIIIFSFAFTSTKENNDWGVLFFVLSFFLIPCYFLVRIHLNYIKFSKGISIKLSGGNETVIIHKYDEKFEFQKSDIKELLIFNPFFFMSDSPFELYGYSKFTLKNGMVFNISCLVMKIHEVRFKNWKIPMKIVKRYYPIIKDEK